MRDVKANPVASQRQQRLPPGRIRLLPEVGPQAAACNAHGHKKTATGAVFLVSRAEGNQRLENCLARRAECRPTFLRSTSRASRVTKPAALSWGLSVAS